MKEHTKSDGLIIGYHGNSYHYREDFFPNGANAFKENWQKNLIFVENHYQ